MYASHCFVTTQAFLYGYETVCFDDNRDKSSSAFRQFNALIGTHSNTKDK